AVVISVVPVVVQVVVPTGRLRIAFGEPRVGASAVARRLHPVVTADAPIGSVVGKAVVEQRRYVVGSPERQRQEGARAWALAAVGGPRLEGSIRHLARVGPAHVAAVLVVARRQRLGGLNGCALQQQRRHGRE